MSDPLPSDGVSASECRHPRIGFWGSEGVGSATFRQGVGVGVPTPQDRFLGVGGCRIRYLPTGCWPGNFAGSYHERLTRYSTTLRDS